MIVDEAKPDPDWASAAAALAVGEVELEAVFADPRARGSATVDLARGGSLEAVGAVVGLRAAVVSGAPLVQWTVQNTGAVELQPAVTLVATQGETERGLRETRSGSNSRVAAVVGCTAAPAEQGLAHGCLSRLPVQTLYRTTATTVSFSVEADTTPD